MWYTKFTSTAIENSQKKTTENVCVFHLCHLLLKRESGRGPNTVWAVSIHNPSQHRQTGGAGRLHRRTQNWGKQEGERGRPTGRPTESWETARDEDSKPRRRRGEERRKTETGRSDFEGWEDSSISRRETGATDTKYHHKISLQLSSREKTAPKYLPSSLCLAQTYPCSSTTTHTQI